MASCRQVESLVQAYVDAELGSSERVVLEQHLNECPQCVQILRAHQAHAAFLFEVFAPERLQEDLTSRVMAHLPEMDPLTPSNTALRRRRFDRPVSWTQRIGNWMPAAVPVVLVLLAITLLVFWPPAQAPGQVVGLVLQREGKVLRSHEQLPEWREAALSTAVVQGEWLETGPSGSLMAGLNGRSELKVGPSSRVRVLGERRVAVETGRVWLSVGRESRLFHVSTPSGDITVLGTTFNVEVDLDSTRVTVAEGEVHVQNDVTFTVVRPGQQVELALERRPLKPEPTNATTVMAWAERIRPDLNAQARFEARLQELHPGRVVRAEQVFVVPVKEHNMDGVTALKFSWQPDLYHSGHSSYDIFVSDTNMNPLFLRRLDAKLFQNKELNNYTIRLGEDEIIRGVSVLHIKVVPDTNNGRIETSFEVEAVGN